MRDHHGFASAGDGDFEDDEEEILPPPLLDKEVDP